MTSGDPKASKTERNMADTGGTTMCSLLKPVPRRYRGCLNFVVGLERNSFQIIREHKATTDGFLRKDLVN